MELYALQAKVIYCLQRIFCEGVNFSVSEKDTFISKDITYFALP